MKYSLFIGRWQPWHEGHQWLIDQRLKEGKNVCIAIRDVETDENQPWQAEYIKGLKLEPDCGYESLTLSKLLSLKFLPPI